MCGVGVGDLVRRIERTESRTSRRLGAGFWTPTRDIFVGA